MMMKRENCTYQYDMAAIIVSYLRNEISEADQRKLDVWLASSEGHKDLFSRICNETMQLEEIRKILSRDANSAWVVLKMKAERRRKQRLFRIYKVAASVVVLFGVSMVLWLKSSNKPVEGERVAVREEIVPGRPMAKLTVASGITYQLDTLGDLMLSSSAAENNGREVIFKDLHEVQDSLPKYGKIEIPRGGEYTMVLSDGTRVYLNSATELRFPESFAGCKERVVYLSGEAFFEVAKDADRPFIVICSTYDVRVLGTSFNISDYADDEDSRTTLASGKVEIDMHNNKQIVLKPGEQAIVTGKGVNVKEVDVELYTTWMYENFRFKGGNIEDIMKKLARWYVVDVFYANQSVKDFHFTGFLPRYAKIEDVLELLSLTTKNIAFEVKGKSVWVREK
ncbi:FecR family protein [uncultured Sanguibacteroides sp.]|uniref:FecR family protein n=1 Tax=uncultured Sanguibacteroides sp. TaxID=1635151 RepID=UPI0025D0C302|nr:FecR family protein [uncultured Sanguibacteroides sp.]